MLGFDALAHRALAEIPQAAQNVTLVAASGAYVVTGAATGGLIGQASQPGSYAVTGYPVGLAVKADHGSYVLTGNVVAFSAGFVASSGAYAVTGSAVTFMPVEAAASGQYAVTGSDASQRLATSSGAYTVTDNAILFPVVLLAESGSYTIMLGSYELRRTGYDYPPDQYGIGHIKLAMAEARRVSRVVKPTPQPVISRPPALRAPAVVRDLPRVSGLIDDTGFMDRLHAKQQEAAAQAEVQSRQQARNRTIAVLLLAA